MGLTLSYTESEIRASIDALDQKAAYCREMALEAITSSDEEWYENRYRSYLIRRNDLVNMLNEALLDSLCDF